VIFLLFVVVASGVGISVVLLRNRKPASMEASIEEFGRSLRALAPELPAEHPAVGPHSEGQGPG
jgi:hypothetical protein